MIALALAAAVAASFGQFDLICQGGKSSYSDSDAAGTAKSEDWNERISVDLRRHVAKLSSQAAPWPIVEANDAQIVLRDQTAPTESERWVIDRTSGRVTAIHDYRMGLHIKRSADCTKAPFTPLPAQAF